MLTMFQIDYNICQNQLCNTTTLTTQGHSRIVPNSRYPTVLCLVGGGGGGGGH